jgi:hypothetical protein
MRPLGLRNEAQRSPTESHVTLCNTICYDRPRIRLSFSQLPLPWSGVGGSRKILNRAQGVAATAG